MDQARDALVRVYWRIASDTIRGMRAERENCERHASDGNYCHADGPYPVNQETVR